MPASCAAPIGTLKALGCDTLILTNAAGSLKTEVGPGEIMLITDHINLTGRNPLIGEPTDARFVGMTGAYDAGLRAALLGAAEREGVAMATGVYMWFSGPSFETPAEIRMARLAGADAVGMSTVPEVILGRFFGLRCAAISTITNFAAGMTGVELSHEETKRARADRRRQARARHPPLPARPAPVLTCRADAARRRSSARSATARRSRPTRSPSSSRA